MRKSIIILLIGLLLGMGIMFYISTSNTLYWKLEEDCNIEDVGYIKKGTLLRVDEGMAEGFTRCILYLNLDDIKVSIDSNKYTYIPYWLTPSE